MYLQYFWEVGTSEFIKISIEKSSKNVTAIQMWFWTVQIRENMKKWCRRVSNGRPQNPWKITKNQFWSRLSGPLHPMITKIMKKLCPKTQNAWKMVSQDLQKSINLWSKMNEICLKRIMQLLNFPMISILQIFQIRLVCKSTVNWLPEGPAARAKPWDIHIIHIYIEREREHMYYT